MINSKHLLLLSLTGVIGLPAAINASPISHEFVNHNNITLTPSLLQHVSTPCISEQSQSFIKNIAERGIGFLENHELSEEKRKKEFRIMLEESFDMKTIGRFALGKYWRQATKKQKQEYLKLFENMIVNVYSRRFGDYNGEKFEVTGAQKQESNDDVIVSSQIIPNSGTPISVDWRVRRKNGGFVVIDIMVEGVSMAVTQRSDFAAVIQRGGGKIDVLLEHLRK